MVKFVFFPLETKITTFFAEVFKIQGDPAPPSDAHGSKPSLLNLIDVLVYTATDAYRPPLIDAGITVNERYERTFRS